MTFVDSSELEVREPLPGWTGRFFHAQNMTFAYYDIAPDATPLHEHQHEQEEVWHVLDGRLEVTVAGELSVAGPGCAVIVPPNTPHSARTIGGCRALVVDTPRRDHLPGD